MSARALVKSLGRCLFFCFSFLSFFTFATQATSCCVPKMDPSTTLLDMKESSRSPSPIPCSRSLRHWSKTERSKATWRACNQCKETSHCLQLTRWPSYLHGNCLFDVAAFSRQPDRACKPALISIGNKLERVIEDAYYSVCNELDGYCLELCISLLGHDLKGDLFESAAVGF